MTFQPPGNQSSTFSTLVTALAGLLVFGVATFASPTPTPTENIVQVQNSDGSQQYFTVSGTSTRVYGDLIVDGTCTGCGGGSVNLNQAYLNATGSPTVALTPSVGPVNFADAIGGSGTVFNVQDRIDSAGNFSVRYLSTSSLGNSMYPSLMVRGPSVPTSNVFEVENLNNSVQYLTVSSTATIAAVPFQAADGIAGGPAFSFSSDTNTGIYRIGSDSLGISAGGLRFQVDSTGAKIIAGSSASPSLGFTTDTNTGLFSAGADILGVTAGGSAQLTVSATSTSVALLAMPGTITPGGTTGNQTINRPSGTVNVAAAASSVTVTNSLVTANSIVLPVRMTLDATCTAPSVVPASGSFVITMVGTCTAETKVGFVVVAPNP